MHAQGPVIAGHGSAGAKGTEGDGDRRIGRGVPDPAGNHELGENSARGGRGANTEGPWRRRRAPWMQPWWEH
jgi:hypothetical protein